MLNAIEVAIKKNILISSLSKGNSCASENMVGFVFSNLTVIKYVGNRILPCGQQQPMVLAQCSCGNIGVYVSNSLRTGWTKSCGCLQAEKTREIHTKHGQKRKGVSRGTRVYSLWKSMLDRCKDGRRYLELGITVCDSWKNSFENFYKDMGEPPSDIHTLDRIDNLKGYYAENCRYATPQEQANNTRRNVWIIIDGKKYTLAQAMRELGLSKRTVQDMSSEQNNKIYHGSKKYRQANKAK